MVYQGITKTCECGTVLKWGERFCQACAPTAQETRPKRLPGEHHSHGLHFGDDATQLRKKESATRYAQSTAVSLPEADTRVVVSVSGPDTDCLIGTVRYSGKTVFAGGDWIGVELDGPHGKNSGSIMGAVYFECEPYHGIFVRPAQIIAKGDGVVPFLEEERIRKDKEARRARKQEKASTPKDVEPAVSLPLSLHESLPEVGTRAAGLICGKRYPGEVRFTGTTKFARGYWIGLCLDIAVGKNSGVVMGVKYFDCPANRGLFVRADACIVPQTMGQADERNDDVRDQNTITTAEIGTMSPEALRDMVGRLMQDRVTLQSEMERMQFENLELAENYEKQFRKTRDASARGAAAPSPSGRWGAKKKDAATEEAEAATKLQSRSRGDPARQKQEESAALKIQSLQRGKKDRAKVNALKRGQQDKAATALQARVRGNKARAAVGQKRIDVAKNSVAFKLRLASLFHALDKNSSGKLYATELHRLAMALGYEETELEAFYDLYEGICTDYDCSPGEGLSVRAFVSLVSTEDGDFDLLYIEGPSLLVNLMKEFGPGDAARQAREASSLGRQLRLQTLAKAADANGDGHINASEMFSIAQIMGFPGTEKDFAVEYKAICRDLVLDFLKGMPVGQFAKKLNRPGDDYFLNEGIFGDFSAAFNLPSGDTPDVPLNLELDDSPLNLKSEETPLLDIQMTRNEQLQMLFQAYDGFYTERLGRSEMYAYAQSLGFPGAEDDFADEYGQVCKDCACDTTLGLDMKSFLQVANDVPGDYFIEEKALKKLLSGFGIDTYAPRSPQSNRTPPLARGTSRSDGIAQLFKALDTQKVGRLKNAEMFSFAQKLGFPDQLSDFQDEYAELCQVYRFDVKVGLDSKAFSQVVNNADGNYLVDEKSLQELLTAFSSKQADAELSPLRKAGIEALFKLCDGQATGRLKLTEMYGFAKKLGFQGAENEFADEYLKLCAEYNEKSSVGLDLEEFTQLVSNSGGSFFVDDPTLAEMSYGPEGNIIAASWPSERKDRLEALFKAFDTGNVGFLKSAEMYRFAVKNDFPGPESEFASEYRDLCQERKCDPKRGIDSKCFLQIVEDQSGNFYLDDSALQEMLAEMGVTLAAASKLKASQGTAPVAKTKRMEQLEAIFIRLTINNRKNRLVSGELFPLAKVLGYPDKETEFAVVFDGICRAFSIEKSMGLDERSFMKLANDSEGDLFCEDAELPSILKELETTPQSPAVAKPAVTAPPPAVSTSTLPGTEASRRAKIAEALYKALDVKKNQKLFALEFFPYAQIVGYPEEMEEFEDDFETLCDEVKCDPKLGLDEKTFTSILNDKESDYCFDDQDMEVVSALQAMSQELKVLLQGAQPQLAQAAPPLGKEQASRQENVASLFVALDLDDDGRLSEQEMLQFANLLQFDCPPNEFSEVFAELCEEFDCLPLQGLDLKMFENVVDEEDGDFNILGEDMPSILQEATKKRKLEEDSTSKTKKVEQDVVTQKTSGEEAKKKMESEAAAKKKKLNEEGDAKKKADQAPANKVAVAKDSPKTRAEFVRALFAALDTNKAGRLLPTEFFPYALKIGYPDGIKEFEEDFDELCDNSPCDAKVFAGLINDAESDYYTEDEQLADILTQLASNQPQKIMSTPVVATAPAAKAVVSSESSPRQKKIRALFQVLDRNKNNYLSKNEMYVFANTLGFDGDISTFDGEYEELVQLAKCDSKQGIDLNSFANLISADEEGEYYCDDDHLDHLHDEIVTPRAGVAKSGASATAGATVPAQSVAPAQPKSRAEFVAAIFEAADRNADGRLNCAEMFSVAKVAQLSNFRRYPESEQEFVSEWRSLCERLKCDPNAGIDTKLFEKVARDNNEDNAFYIADKDLPSFAKKLRQKAAETAGAKPPTATQPGAPKTRAELLQSMFVCLDAKRNKRLVAEEMFRYAALIGYPDDFREFAGEDFQNLCKEAKSEPRLGLDEAAFIKLVSQDRQSDYYAEDAQLPAFLKKLTSKLSQIATTAAPASAMPSAKPESNVLLSRTELVRALFQALDKKQSGRLLQEELLVYARLNGYPGGAQEFREEYDGICKQNKFNSSLGLDSKNFENLISANKDGDYYSDDEELKVLLQQLQSPAKLSRTQEPRTRAEFVAAIFEAVDRNRDGFLDQSEMFTYAQASGFPEPEEDFIEEWTSLCKEMSLDPKKGVDMRAFQQITADSDSPYVLQDSGMATMLNDVRG